MLVLVLEYIVIKRISTMHPIPDAAIEIIKGPLETPSTLKELI